MSKLEVRIIKISKKHGLSHNGSNLTCVGIIDEIYSIKKDDEPFILSCGHSFLSLAVVLEKYYGFNAEELYLKHGTHPNRDMEHKIWCSTGSLGHGFLISIGMAIANPNKKTYCLISDGEMFEGAIYEGANVISKYKIDNLVVYLNFNGLSAYDEVPETMKDKIKALMPNINIVDTKVEDYGLTGLSAHYCKL